MKTTDEVLKLCDVVRETSYAIHVYLHSGHLEKVYENALAQRLRKQGINVETQFALPVFDENGTILGDFYANLLVERCLIVELKAARLIADEHIAQLLGYLRAARIEHGLLINFGGPRLQVRKYILSRQAE